MFQNSEYFPSPTHITSSGSSPANEENSIELCPLKMEALFLLGVCNLAWAPRPLNYWA